MFIGGAVELTSSTTAITIVVSFTETTVCVVSFILSASIPPTVSASVITTVSMGVSSSKSIGIVMWFSSFVSVVVVIPGEIDSSSTWSSLPPSYGTTTGELIEEMSQLFDPIETITCSPLKSSI